MIIITAKCRVSLQKGVSKQKSHNRQGKFFGLLAIVSFNNFECNTNRSDTLRGKEVKVYAEET